MDNVHLIQMRIRMGQGKGRVLRVTTSIWIVLYHHDGEDVETLVRRPISSCTVHKHKGVIAVFYKARDDAPA